MNPTVVMTDMGKKAWSDPVKGDPMKNQIPQGKFAGKIIKAPSEVTKRVSLPV